MHLLENEICLKRRGELNYQRDEECEKFTRAKQIEWWKGQLVEENPRVSDTSKVCPSLCIYFRSDPRLTPQNRNKSLLLVCIAVLLGFSCGLRCSHQEQSISHSYEPLQGFPWLNRCYCFKVSRSSGKKTFPRNTALKLTSGKKN